MNALVLTGRVLAGKDGQDVWVKVASLFKLDQDGFGKRVLARTPLSIREAPDAAELQKLSAALQNLGAEVEIVQADESKWFVQQDSRICGPVPLPYLKGEYQAGRMAGDAPAKQVTDKDWTTLANALGEPAATFDLPSELEHDIFEPPTAALQPNPAVSQRETLPPELVASRAPASTPHAEPPPLPGGGFTHTTSTEINGVSSAAIQNLIVIALIVIAVLLILFKGAVALGISLIVATSAVWVYLDATKHGIGSVLGKSSMFNMSAGAWGIVTLMLWIIAFPAYLVKRGSLIENAKLQPVTVTNRSNKAIALGVCGGLLVLRNLALYVANM